MQKVGMLFSLKLFFSYTFQLINLALQRVLLPRHRRELLPLSELATELGVPYISTEDINSLHTVSAIKALQPDVLVSALLLQIVKPALLSVPKKCSINFHPALVSQHRGGFSGFWTLLKSWRHGGATVHIMTPKLDAGAIIIQRRFFVYRSDSLHTVNARAARLGGRLLFKALRRIHAKARLKRNIQKLGELFRVPSVKDVAAFEKKGHHIIHWRELFRWPGQKK